MQSGQQGAGQVRTYDESTQQAVTFDEAVSLWSLAARDALLETAADYHVVVTYQLLGDRVQAATGIRTTKPVFQWVDEVLARVTAECAARDEPFLSALCVRADGSVGPAYARAVVAATGRRPTDPGEHAAQERLRCHQSFGAELPPDGGVAARPTTTLRQASTRATSRGSVGTTTRSPSASGSSTTRPTPPPRPARAPARIPGSPASPAPVRTAAAPPAPPVCPTCFTVLPATGRCDTCD